MKRFSVVLAVLLLIPILALADSECLSLRAYDVTLNKMTDTIACRPEDAQYYTLIDASGKTLADESAEYVEMRPRDAFFLVEKKVPDGIHRKGLIDGQGNVLVPVEYADINVLSGRWQVGLKLTPSSAEDKDYTYTNYDTGEKSFYQIDTADFYFDGEKAGTLSRYEYGSGTVTVRGAYIYVVDSAREGAFYDSHMVKSPYVPEYSTSSEYDLVNVKGKAVYFHRGTGQQAFTETCTLNPADLENPYLYDHANLYDIQGKLLFQTLAAYDSIEKFNNGCAVTRMDGKRGLMRIDGREVIPAEYDSIGYWEDAPLRFGCISAVKDGKFGFLDAQGRITCDFAYPENIVSNRVTFGSLKNLDGTVIVLSGIVGELPEHYADVQMNGTGAAAFIGQNSEKQYCVVDLSGKTLVPYGDYKSVEVSNDAGVAVVYYGSRQYDIFRFAPYSAANAEAEGEPAQADVPQADAPAETGWTCPNGHTGNQGNFCPECGAPKPEETTALTNCAACGYDFSGEAPKFCPNCGTPTGLQ